MPKCESLISGCFDPGISVGSFSFIQFQTQTQPPRTSDGPTPWPLITCWPHENTTTMSPSSSAFVRLGLY